MTGSNPRVALVAGAVLVLGVGLAAGLIGRPMLERANGAAAGQTASAEREILYWYDPMLPNERYPGPGRSSMNMELIPKYADEADGAPGVRIDPSLTQNLGMRLATARRASLEGDLNASAVIDYNQRDVAIVQARAAGFVQRVYSRAPGDVIAAGAPLVDLLIPEWAGAQGEYLAVRRTGDAALIEAARRRLLLLGMSEALIVQVERTGRPRTTVTIVSPSAGAIRTLGVRAGMSVTPGMTLAEISGLSTVWLNAAIPELQAGRLRLGQSVEVALSAFPGERFSGRLTALLPEVSGDSRTLTARIEMANRAGLLRPGMYGQITFGGGGGEVLVVPSEAVIRTGERTLVMLALPEGRYQPAEVRTGRESGGMTEIVAGLAEGERLVASGQFLIDSEASLSGMAARPISGERPTVPPASSATPPAPAAANGHAGHGGAAQ
ncbi:efflux RND transporter periplasmic adaptor subunit [Brevundimonas sp.]|uniref:efflux RND transporter periplasmic adaptor subunit n=1 Tax=Brevundimonas sp. TaxID=1871086 RepID=UPI00356632A1